MLQVPTLFIEHSAPSGVVFMFCFSLAVNKTLKVLDLFENCDNRPINKTGYC